VTGEEERPYGVSACAEQIAEVAHGLRRVAAAVDEQHRAVPVRIELKGLSANHDAVRADGMEGEIRALEAARM
jgi:hypothetical protein